MSGGRRGKDEAPEDIDLWQEVARQVRPLSPKQSTVQPSPREKPAAQVKVSQAPRERRPPPKGSDTPLRHGTSSGLDKRQGERLRKGKLPIEGRLDLHGLYQDAAHRALERFLAGSVAQGKRCVLVITGKGRGDSGVLRQEVPRWLNQSPNRALVVSFTYAQLKDGGEGALYILLKRQR